MKRVCTKCGYSKHIKRRTWQDKTVCPKCRHKSMEFRWEHTITDADKKQVLKNIKSKPRRNLTAEGLARIRDRSAYRRGGL